MGQISSHKLHPTIYETDLQLVVKRFEKTFSISTMLMYFSAINAEKREENFKSSIKDFNRRSLKHTETQEKNPLPSKESKTHSYILVTLFCKMIGGRKGLRIEDYLGQRHTGKCSKMLQTLLYCFLC